MFDEIFKRWINSNALTQNDLVPLLLEWNQTFGNKKATNQDAFILLQCVQINYYSLMLYILKMVGIKRGYQWAEIYNKDGSFKARFWQVNPDN